MGNAAAAKGALDFARTEAGSIPMMAAQAAM
jgi:hypothetical protein